jgi:hypothetical protein
LEQTLRSQPTLKRLYRQYNKKYFGNKLPKILVAFATPKEFLKGGLGKKTLAVTLFKHEAPVAIYIRRELDKHWSYIKLDLLHEMAHVALPASVNHGPRFKAEMLRLEKAGAFRKLL